MCGHCGQHTTSYFCVGPADSNRYRCNLTKYEDWTNVYRNIYSCSVCQFFVAMTQLKFAFWCLVLTKSSMIHPPKNNNVRAGDVVFDLDTCTRSHTGHWSWLHLHQNQGWGPRRPSLIYPSHHSAGIFTAKETEHLHGNSRFIFPIIPFVVRCNF